MRFFIRESVLIIVTGIFGGCGSSTGTNSAGQAVTSDATTVASSSTGVMQSGGTNVLRVAIPADCKCVAKEGSLKITGPHMETEVWLVRDAQTVDAVIGQVPQLIDSEFKNLKVDGTTDLTIAGSPAKRLTGPGNEADDGDPGRADVIVFKLGDHVFVGCTHDEHLAAVNEQRMLTLVQSVQIP